MPAPDPSFPIVVEEIFRTAAALPVAERAAYLDAACEGQAGVRARVERMLEVQGIGAFLQHPPDETIPPEIEAELARLKPEEGGERIGHYKLLEQIGEGGFGIVWMAEQIEPVRRRVALKILKLGMDTKEVIARFEQERQALAMMDHPNIAKVHDAGATQHGRPFFVMELVRGIPITDYCDQHNLPTAERLQLFIAVCHAVQHAHQKGIIHRDLKPSNILVTLHDGMPVPKVIDFGVAKATQSLGLTDLTLFTQFQQMIGTPLYMSPEQAEMSGIDIDTRSDIYSLGVLLYELLTGRTPFDPEELMRKGYDEIRRAIREQEPQKPSTALSTMAADARTTIAQHRQADGAKLVGLIRGDLDWIVMKALEKERVRRYESASSLALDIQRHLQSEPVIARPATRLYRFRRLVRRNKLAFAASAAVAIVLLIGIVVSMWQAIRATTAEREQRRLREDAEKARAGETVQRQQATRSAAEARKAVTRLEIEKAETFFAGDNSGRALAFLARLLRQQPTNRVVAERVLSALGQRNFSLPVAPALRHDEPERGSNEPLGKTSRFLGSVPLRDLVRSANFSPDGQRIVTAGKDGTARLWDSRTGALACPPLQHAGEVIWAQFSPNGKTVVTASLDRTARLWNPNTGQSMGTPFQHLAPVVYAEFSPDSRQVATVSQDGVVRLWDAETGQAVSELMKKRGAYYAGFSPDGKQLLVAAQPSANPNDCSAIVVDAGTHSIVASYRHFFDLEGETYFPQFSRDGQLVVSANTIGSHGFAISQITAGGTPAVELKHNSIGTAARFSPDGRTLATASWDGSARLWDARTGAALAAPLHHHGIVLSVGFSPDGLRLITASRDQFTRLWDVASGKALAEPIRHGSEVATALFGGDGMHFATIAGGKAALLWQARSGQAPVPLSHDNAINYAVFSRDGRRVATACDDGTARVWDARTGEPLTAPLKGNRLLRFIEFSPNGQRLATCSLFSAAYIWDFSGDNPVSRMLQHTASVYSIRFSADGQRVVTSCRDGAAHVWDARNGERLITLQHADHVNYAEFSLDGRRIVTASWDGTAQVWDADTGAALFPPLRHDAEVLWAAFSPDGRAVATASRDKTVRLWDMRTGKMSAKPLTHSDELLQNDSIHFSPDGSQIATAAGNTAQIWNARDGQPTTPPIKHGAKLESVRFSPDGTRLITSCLDNTARVWDANSGHALSEPLNHGSYHAEFSPDGQRVVTVGKGTARIWDVPTVPLPVPDWLPDLAEAVAGQRIDDQDISLVTPIDELFKLRQRLGHVQETDYYHTWVKWFFAEGATRTISPWSAFTFGEYVQRQVEQNSLGSLREAVLVSPGNALALARLAVKVLAQDALENPRQFDEADWYSRQATTLAPTEPEVWRARAAVLVAAAVREGPVAKDATPPVVTAAGDVPPSKTGTVGKSREWEEAFAAYSKAIDLSDSIPAFSSETRSQFLLGRSEVLKRLDRPLEAQQDFLAAKKIPNRDPQAKPNHIDLSDYYNGSVDEAWLQGVALNHFPHLTKGMHNLADVQFDVRGVVQLSSQELRKRASQFPEKIVGIKVGRQCVSVHFLHATAWTTPAGTQIGRYVLHFAGGSTIEIPIVYGEDILDWSVDSRETNRAAVKASRAIAIETGRNEAARDTRLFKTMWTNPNPELLLDSIDYLSAMTEAAPFLIGITLE